MKMKRLAAAGLALLCAAGPVKYGFFPGKRAQETGLRTIRWLANSPGEDGWEVTTKPILAAFEERTGIHVDAEFYSFDNLFDVIETRASTGDDSYDVVSVDVTYIAKYAMQGFLEELGAYFDEAETGEFEEQSLASGSYGGGLYALPENTSSQLLFYNRTLLEEAGVEVRPADPGSRLTYEEVAEMAERALRVLDPDRRRGLIGFDFQQVSRVYQMNMLANALGGKNIGEDGLHIRGVVDSEPWLRALSWYGELAAEGIASREYNAGELWSQFAGGNMIFMIGAPWTLHFMNVDDEIGYTYAPVFADCPELAATPTGSWYFGMNPHSRKKEDAAQFLRYFTLGEGNDMWLKIDGDVPARRALLEAVKADPEADGVMKICAYEVKHTAVPRAVTPAFAEYAETLDNMWEDVRNGCPAEEAAAYAVRQFDSLAAKYRR